MIKKTFITIAVILLSFGAFSQEKYALIVGVSDYGNESDWSNLDTELDVLLVKKAIETQGFKTSNIITLQDADATKEGILEALTNLSQKAQRGDVVYFHFSGHGQHMWEPDDTPKDEPDGWDESLVCYGAKTQYSIDYKGESHLRDDELKLIIDELQQKLGESGNVFFTIDACYSGSIERGGLKVRGAYDALKPKGYSPPPYNVRNFETGLETTKAGKDKAPVIVFSASPEFKMAKQCQISDIEGYENTQMGTLSYALQKELGSGEYIRDYNSLFNRVKSSMAKVNPKEVPVASGNLDIELFAGTSTKYPKYYKVTDNYPDIRINAGIINEVQKGAKFGIYPPGTTEPTGNLKIGTAVVKKAYTLESIIEITEGETDDNWKNYHFFLEEKTYNTKTKVFLDLTTDIDPVANALKKEPNISITDEKNTANIVIRDSSQNNNSFLIFYDAKFDLNTTVKTEPNNPEKRVEKVKEMIGYINKRTFLREFNSNNNDYRVSYKIEPISDTTDCDSTQPIDEYYINGQYIFSLGQAFNLSVTNTSKKTILYYHIIAFEPDGKLTHIAPKKVYDDIIYLDRVGSGNMICGINEKEKTGQFLFKIIASDHPMEDLPKMINSLARILKRKGTLSQLETVVNNFAPVGRAVQGRENTNISNMNYYTTEFTLQITP